MDETLNLKFWVFKDLFNCNKFVTFFYLFIFGIENKVVLPKMQIFGKLIG